MTDEPDERHYLNFSERFIMNELLAQCLSVRQTLGQIACKLPDTNEYNIVKAEYEQTQAMMDELAALVRNRIKEQLAAAHQPTAKPSPSTLIPRPSLRDDAVEPW